MNTKKIELYKFFIYLRKSYTTIGDVPNDNKACLLDWIDSFLIIKNYSENYVEYLEAIDWIIQDNYFKNYPIEHQRKFLKAFRKELKSIRRMNSY